MSVPITSINGYYVDFPKMEDGVSILGKIMSPAMPLRKRTAHLIGACQNYLGVINRRGDWRMPLKNGGQTKKLTSRFGGSTARTRSNHPCKMISNILI